MREREREGGLRIVGADGREGIMESRNREEFDFSGVLNGYKYPNMPSLICLNTLMPL